MNWVLAQVAYEEETRVHQPIQYQDPLHYTIGNRAQDGDGNEWHHRVAVEAYGLEEGDFTLVALHDHGQEDGSAECNAVELYIYYIMLDI
jgi:hypothetical protein